MSTRTRIVLTFVDHRKYVGSRAVKLLMSLPIRRPLAWEAMPKRERLLYIAKFLRPGERLQLFQERKGTRVQRSLYWAEYKKPCVPNVVVVPQKPPRVRDVGDLGQVQAWVPEPPRVVRRPIVFDEEF